MKQHKLRALHLSDLHERGPREPAPWRRRRVFGDAWEANIDALLEEGPIDLVFFTGDVADWGSTAEYERASDFVAALLERLRLPSDRFFPVPGNHDVTRTVARDAWTTLRRDLPRVPSQEVSRWMAGGPPPFGLPAELREEVLRRQEAYLAWVSRGLGRPELLPDRSPHRRLGYRASITLPGHPFAVHVLGFDTAWLAGDDADSGQLRLTEDQVMLLATGTEGRSLEGLRLALMHHPLSDLSDASDCQRLLSDHVDLVMRGHLHKVAPETWADPGHRLHQLAAGCLYEGHRADEYPNACHVIEATLDDRGRPLRIDLRFRAWSPRGHWHDDNSLYADTRDGRLTWVVAPGGAPTAASGLRAKAPRSSLRERTRVSRHFNLGRSQPALDFLDVDVHGDDALFVDPYALRVLRTRWGHECSALIRNFFEAVIRAIREGRQDDAQRLLGGLREPNETHLGLSKGQPRGRALGPKSAELLWRALAGSEAVASGLVVDLEDTALMVEGVDVDIVSDIATNLIREPLIHYTQDQCALLGIPLEEAVDSGPLWDPETGDWTSRFEPLPVAGGRKLLLVPKVIVRRRMHYSHDEYFNDYVLEHLRQVELASPGSQLVKLMKGTGAARVTRKDLIAKYGAGKRTAARCTRESPEVLRQYRRDKEAQDVRPLSHEELAEALEMAPPDWPRLLGVIGSIPPVAQEAGAYYSAVEKFLVARFYPALTSPRTAPVRPEDTCLSITFANSADQGLFATLARELPVAFVCVECHNAVGVAAELSLDGMLAKFSPTHGQVGLLVYRAFDDKAAVLARCAELSRSRRGWIVPLDDADLVALTAVPDGARALEFDVIRARLDRSSVGPSAAGLNPDP